MNINKMKKAELIQEIERLRGVNDSLKAEINKSTYKYVPPATSNKVIREDPSKVPYANAEQCAKDKADQDNISNYQDKYPTAKQVDLICGILATKKIHKDCPQIHSLTKASAAKLIKFLSTMPTVYRDHTSSIQAVKLLNKCDWNEACRLVKLIEGQKAYDKLVDRYGMLPTLTYAHIVK